LGGDFQNLASLNGKEYGLHKKATWAVEISVDDLDVTNIIFRNKVGIPNWRAMCETADGIYYIDDTDEIDPHFRILTLDTSSTEVIPRSVSKQFKINDVRVGVDLSAYSFDQAATVEFGDFILFACRTKISAHNNRVFVYNKTSKATNILDYFVSNFAIYEGTLVAGDSITDNVYTLFSGTDDNQSLIDNFYEGSIDNLGYEGLKRTVEITMEGDIGPEQAIKVSLSTDRSPFVEVRSKDNSISNVHAIEGNGEYVDKTQRVAIGSLTLGRGELGGGGDGLEAYHYKRTFRISLDKFQVVTFRVEATKLGYASVSEFTYDDVRVKWNRVPNKYRNSR